MKKLLFTVILLLVPVFVQAQGLSFGGANYCGLVACTPPDNSLFSWVGSAGTSTIDTTTPGSIYLKTQTGTSGLYLRQATTPGTAFTATVWLDLLLTQPNNLCGFGVRDTATGRIEMMHILNYLSTGSSGGLLMQINHYDTATYVGNDYTSTGIAPPYPASLAMRVQWTGSVVKFSWSPTGIETDFQEVLSAAPYPAALSHLIYGCAPGNATIPASVRLRSWKVTTP